MTGIISTFDYGALAPDDAIGLRERAVRLRGLITKSTADMIHIGCELAAIRTRLDHGQFAAWVEREIGVSTRTAQNYMAIAKLAEGKNEIISLFPPSAVRMLAAKSAPPEIVEQIVTSASDGDIMSDTTINEMIAAGRQEKKLEKRVADAAQRKARGRPGARARRAAEREEYLAEREREKAKNHAAAQSIVNRLSPDDIQFITATLFDGSGVLDELYMILLSLRSGGAA